MITRKGNAVTVGTENAGIIIKFTSEVKTDPPEIYMALTGDQVAITNIRIERPGSGDNSLS